MKCEALITFNKIVTFLSYLVLIFKLFCRSIKLAPPQSKFPKFFISEFWAFFRLFWAPLPIFGLQYFFLLPRSKVRDFGTNFTAGSLTFMHWSSYMRALYNSGSKNVNNLKRQNLSVLC